MANHLFILGYGYTAGYIVKNLGQDWIKTATSRSKTSEHCSIIPYDESAITKALQTATHLIISIAPHTNGDTFLCDFADTLKKAEKLKWIGYLSSTSVYGNHDGKWVDEDTVCSPTSERGRIRLIAENQWLEQGKILKGVLQNIMV